MALAQYGSIITALRGSIAGMTFQRGLGSNIVRTKPNPTKSSSLDRNFVRYICFKINVQWVNFSDAQRLTWHTFATFINHAQKKNKSLFVSGKQIFFYINFYRCQYGYAIMTSPIFTAYFPADFTVVPALHLGALWLNFSRVLDPANEYVIVKATAPLRPGVNNFKNRLMSTACTTIANASQDIAPGYLSRFGFNPIAGQTIGFSIAIGSLWTGLLTLFQESKIVL